MSNRKKEIPQENEEISKENEEILKEINRLRHSPYVKFAKAEENRKLKQQLYQLRSLEKRGKKLIEALEKEGMKEQKTEESRE